MTHPQTPEQTIPSSTTSLAEDFKSAFPNGLYTDPFPTEDGHMQAVWCDDVVKLFIQTQIDKAKAEARAEAFAEAINIVSDPALLHFETGNARKFIIDELKSKQNQ